MIKHPNKPWISYKPRSKKVAVAITCITTECKKKEYILASDTQLALLLSGSETIDSVFPDITEEQRAMLKGGQCYECFVEEHNLMAQKEVL